MSGTKVLICPNCRQGHPWHSGLCFDLGSTEDWTDYIRYSPRLRSSFDHIDTRKHLIIPTLRTCLSCGYIFKITPSAPSTPDQASAQTPAGFAGSAQYLEFLKRSSQLSDAECIDILLEAWVRSNDRLRLGSTEEFRDPNRMEILSWIVSCLQNQTGPNRVRAAEAARQSGNFRLAITLLNHQFEARVKPFADFVRDLALLGDVLVRKVAVYPDIIAFERAKTRAVENAAELTRTQAEWEKQKKDIETRHGGLAGFGCLFLLAGIFAAGKLGEWTPFVVFLGIVLWLVYLPLSSKASRKAKAWEAAHPKPDWKVLTPTFSENPPVIGFGAISSSPPAREPSVGLLSEGEQTTHHENKQSALAETALNEWRDPALEVFAQKVKALIETNSGMLDVFLLESEKSFSARQSFVKHQILAYAFVFTFECKKRYPLLHIGHQNQLIREIKVAFPLLAYSADQLIQGFHDFEADLLELSQENQPDGLKFFFDSKPDGDSLSIPGYLATLVCLETKLIKDGEEPPAFKFFRELFNVVIRQTQKEHLFDQIVDEFIERRKVAN